MTTSNANWLFIVEAAERIGCRPKDISDLLYQQKFDTSRCLKKRGKRLIAESDLPILIELLTELGRIRRPEVTM